MFELPFNSLSNFIFDDKLYVSLYYLYFIKRIHFL